jgi:hypothetical protein
MLFCFFWFLENDFQPNKCVSYVSATTEGTQSEKPKVAPETTDLVTRGPVVAHAAKNESE